MNNKDLYFHTSQTMHASFPWPPLSLPPLFSFTIPKNKNKKKKQKKTCRNKSQKVCMKTSACRDGTLKNQLNQMQMTPQYHHTIPISCVILPTTDTTKLSHALSLPTPTNKHGMHHCSFHSLPHKRQSISAMFSSSKFHNITYTRRHHTGPALFMHRLHSFCIQDKPYLPCSVATTLQPPTT